MATADHKLALSRKHLLKVEEAWELPDWADLSLYGLYCLEAAVDAATIHYGHPVQAQHWSRVDAAQWLHSKHGLPDIAELLRELNEARKSEAYGDVEAPELDAEEVANSISVW